MEDNDLLKESLRRINQFTALFVKDFNYPGYTFNELNVLGTIVRQPGIIARDICEYNVIDRGYLSKILKKLEQNRLILRVAEKHPPFEKALSVTPYGACIYVDAEKIVDRNIDTRLAGMSSAEQEAFFRCVAEMLQYLRRMAPDASAVTSSLDSAGSGRR